MKQGSAEEILDKHLAIPHTNFLQYEREGILKAMEEYAKASQQLNDGEKWEVKSSTSSIADTGDYYTQYWLEKKGEMRSIHLNSDDEEDYIEMADKLNSVQASQQNISVEGFANLIDEFTDFTLSTFKEAHALSSLEKLNEEIIEVAHEIQHGHENLAEEYADCIMCLCDSAARMGIKGNDLVNAFVEKLKVNKSRKWIKNADNTYSHV